MARKKSSSKPSPLVESLRREVRRRMEEDGITQAELARELGCSPANVSKILQGDSDLQGETIFKLARAVGLEITVASAQDGSAEDSAGGRRSLVGPPRKRKTRTKTGHRYDYSRHLGHMAQLIVKAELSRKKPSEREAAGATVEWADGQEDLAQVSAGTLRRHFAEDRERLLAEARRELGVSPQPRQEQPPAASRPVRTSRSPAPRATGSRPDLGGTLLDDQPGCLAEIHRSGAPLEEVSAADPDLTAPTQAVARELRADISITKLADPVGELTRELDESRRYSRPIRVPSLADFPSSARLPEVGLAKHDPYYDAHRKMKRMFEELKVPSFPNLTKPWPR